MKTATYPEGIKREGLSLVAKREFANGIVYALKTEDEYPIEVTDTFLPVYTKDAIGRKQNTLTDCNVSDRTERWLIGVSCMSGCPVRCKFCATGKLKKWRNLTSDEIVEQVMFVVNSNTEYDPKNSKEFKINYTRMGDSFLNVDNVKEAISKINERFPNAHHYISTIGIQGSDFSWIKDNITLQLSLHSLNDKKRDWLIPYNRKMSIQELGRVSTESNLKTTLNMTLVDEEDWDIKRLTENFNKDKFFVKISPVNKNDISIKNDVGDGIVKGINLV